MVVSGAIPHAEHAEPARDTRSAKPASDGAPSAGCPRFLRGAIARDQRATPPRGNAKRKTCVEQRAICRMSALLPRRDCPRPARHPPREREAQNLRRAARHLPDVRASSAARLPATSAPSPRAADASPARGTCKWHGYRTEARSAARRRVSPISRRAIPLKICPSNPVPSNPSKSAPSHRPGRPLLPKITAQNSRRRRAPTMPGAMNCRPFAFRQPRIPRACAPAIPRTTAHLAAAIPRAGTHSPHSRAFPAQARIPRPAVSRITAPRHSPHSRAFRAETRIPRLSRLPGFHETSGRSGGSRRASRHAFPSTTARTASAAAIPCEGTHPAPCASPHNRVARVLPRAGTLPATAIPRTAAHSPHSRASRAETRIPRLSRLPGSP